MSARAHPRGTPPSNLLVLLEVWLRRWTGLLRIRSPQQPAGSDIVIEIADGGLIHPNAWSVLLRALQDSSFLPTPGPVAGAGHRRALGSLLSLASRQLGAALDDALAVICAEIATPSSAPIGLHLMPGLTLPHAAELQLALSAVDEMQDALLREGVAAAEVGDWDRADGLLSAARDRRFDHPHTLAWLAWVRSQNPRRDLEERLQDAARLMLVAEQLAPDDPEVRARARAIRQALSRGDLLSAGQIRPQGR